MTEKRLRSVRAVLAAMGLSVTVTPLTGCGSEQVGNLPPVDAGRDAGPQDAITVGNPPADVGSADIASQDVGNPPPDTGVADAGAEDATGIGNPPPDSGSSDAE